MCVCYVCACVVPMLALEVFQTMHMPPTARGESANYLMSNQQQDARVSIYLVKDAEKSIQPWDIYFLSIYWC